MNSLDVIPELPDPTTRAVLWAHHSLETSRIDLLERRMRESIGRELSRAAGAWRRRRFRSET
jgi:hypothetical protein